MRPTEFEGFVAVCNRGPGLFAFTAIHNASLPQGRPSVESAGDNPRLDRNGDLRLDLSRFLARVALQKPPWNRQSAFRELAPRLCADLSAPGAQRGPTATKHRGQEDRKKTLVTAVFLTLANNAGCRTHAPLYIELTGVETELLNCKRSIFSGFPDLRGNVCFFSQLLMRISQG